MSPPPAKKSKSARPEKQARYQRQYATVAKKMCALGATPADLADAFGVDLSTIGQWQVSHPEFADALRLGKDHAGRRVEHALHQRAVGYSYIAQKAYKGVIMEYRIHVPADPAAAQFYLMNACPERYRVPSKIEAAADEESPLDALARSLEGCVLRPKED